MSCDWDPTSRYFAVAGGEVAVYDVLQKEVVSFMFISPPPPFVHKHTDV